MKKYRIYLDCNSRKATHIVSTPAEVKAVLIANLPNDGRALITTSSVVVDSYEGRCKAGSYLAKVYMGELSLNPCYSEAYTHSNF